MAIVFADRTTEFKMLNDQEMINLYNRIIKATLTLITIYEKEYKRLVREYESASDEEKGPLRTTAIETLCPVFTFGWCDPYGLESIQYGRGRTRQPGRI